MKNSVYASLTIMRTMLRVQQRQITLSSFQQCQLRKCIVQLNTLGAAYLQAGIGGLLYAAVAQDVQLSMLCSFFRKRASKVRMARLYGSVMKQAKVWWRQLK